MRMLAAVWGALGVLCLNMFWMTVWMAAGAGAAWLPLLYVTSLFSLGVYMGYRLPYMEWYSWTGSFLLSLVWLLLEEGQTIQPFSIYVSLIWDAGIVAGCVLFGSMMYTVLFPQRHHAEASPYNWERDKGRNEKY